jgi:hypothetical protein
MEPIVSEPVRTGFFIAGAAKAGTSALHQLLEKHPSIAMSSVKEPNYFSWDLIEQQGLYYHAEDVRDHEDYEQLFRKGDGLLRGESSVSYLFYPQIAQRLFDYNPHAKIIVLLREPVARAQSHYGMDHALGLIDISLEQVWKNGSGDPKTGLYFQQYFELGLYAKQLREYFTVFPKEQLLVLLHKDLREKRAETIEQLLRFLNLQPFPLIPDTQEVNTGMQARISLFAVLYKNRTFRSVARKLLGNTLAYQVKRVFFTRKKTGAYSIALQKEWQAFYKQDIESLERLIGRSLESWKTMKAS